MFGKHYHKQQESKYIMNCTKYVDKDTELRKIEYILRKYPLSTCFTTIIICPSKMSNTVKQHLHKNNGITLSELQFSNLQCYEYIAPVKFGNDDIECRFKLIFGNRVEDIKIVKSIYNIKQVILVVAVDDVNINTQVASALTIFHQVHLITVTEDTIDDKHIKNLDKLLEMHSRLLSSNIITLYSDKEINNVLDIINIDRLSDRITKQNALYERLLRTK